METLSGALYAKWENDHSGKYTREARAHLMGISVATAERILARKGTDRATLSLVYRNLGLAWDDSFCEYVQPDPAPVATSTPVEPRRRSEPRAKLRRWWPAVAASMFATTGFAIVFAHGLSTLGRTNPHPQELWATRFYKVLAEGSAKYHNGDFPGARKDIEDAVDMARKNHSSGDLASALRMKGDLEEAAGNFGEAQTLYRKALDLREWFGDKVSVPALLEALGSLETKTGSYDLARNHLNESLELYTRFHEPVGVAMVRRDLGSLSFELRHLDAADEWFQSALASLAGHDKPDMSHDILARQAMVLGKRGDTAGARLQLTKCLNYWIHRQHPRWVAVTQMQVAEIEAQAGNTSVARDLLATCRSQFAKIGDKAGAQSAAKRLQKIGEGPQA